LALARLGWEEWKARTNAAWGEKDTAGRDVNTGAERVAAEIRSLATAPVSWARPEKRLAIFAFEKIPPFVSRVRGDKGRRAELVPRFLKLVSGETVSPSSPCTMLGARRT